MSHNLNLAASVATTEVGTDGFILHDIGQRVDKAMTEAEVNRLGELDVQVEKRSIYAGPDSLHDGFRPVHWGVFRKDNGEFLAPCGAFYAARQYNTLTRTMFTLVDSENARADSAGLLGGGRRAWLSVKIPQDFEVTPGDKHYTYVLGVASHDSSVARAFYLLTHRLTCHNQIMGVISRAREGTYFRTKNTINAVNREAEIVSQIGNIPKTLANLAEKFRKLAQRRITKESYFEVMNRLFSVDMSNLQKESTKKTQILQRIAEIFEHNDGDAFPVQRGTAFNMLNAVTNFVDHERGTRLTNRLRDSSVERARAESAMFGAGNDLKSKALEVILEVTANDPVHTVVYSTPGKSFLDDVIANTVS